MSWIENSAPANIALIKYMGKLDQTVNKPTNSSLSYSLQKLRTFVRIRRKSIEEFNSSADTNPLCDSWSAYHREDLLPLNLSETGRVKFLNHFNFLKKEFKLNGFFEIESANNFPADCGLASSASSYAALTLVTHEWFLKNSEGRSLVYSTKELAKLAQKGSGSSCRSFFNTWSLWHQDGVEAIQLPYSDLKHLVILCDEGKKSISSSQAHLRVITSDLFKGRPERAEHRLQNLIQALRSENWDLACRLSWTEFWDMHNLFHTSEPAFFYMNAKCLEVLTELNDFNLELQKKDLNNKKSTLPMITMDAGSNIHLLFQQNQSEVYETIKNRYLNQIALWTDEGYFAKQ